MANGDWNTTNPISGLTPAVPFILPGHLGKLDFRGPEFFLSLGRAVARRTAPLRVITSQALSSFHTLSGFINATGPDMSLDAGIANLNEFKVANTAHDLGVAIAYIVASRLGYSWVCLAEDLIKPSGPPTYISKKCPDMLFERGDRSNSLIAIEAKGRTRKHSNSAINQLHKELEKACREQVGNVIGYKTKFGSTIVHGYAVGAWVPRGGPPGSFHVCEIDQPSSPPRTARQSTPAPEEDSPEVPLAITAAQTYLAGTRLVGDFLSENRLADWLSSVSVKEVQSSFTEPPGDEDIEDLFTPGLAEYENQVFRIGPPIPGFFLDPNLTGTFHFAFSVGAVEVLLDATTRGIEAASETLELRGRLRTSEPIFESFSFVDPSGLAILYSDEILIMSQPQSK